MKSGTPFYCAAILLSAVAVAPARAQPATRISFAGWTAEQQERFLINARIASEKPIGQGITHTQRITLTDGSKTHDAHVQTIDIFKPVYRTKEFVEKDFHDSYKYNIAAWRVDRMLALGLMPPCVYREVDAKPASVCWWVDNIQFDELTRRERKLEPPDGEKWTRQLNLVRVFDQLIDNTDRNQGNLLIDRDWNLWMIDHSRAFRVTHALRRPDVLKRVSVRMLNAMRDLNIERCNAELRPYLTDEEIRTLLVRRDLLLRFFADAVTEKGADAVYLDLPRKTPSVTIP